MNTIAFVPVFNGKYTFLLEKIGYNSSCKWNRPPSGPFFYSD